MHVKSLKVFCDVVVRRSFSRAADDNGISQSGASQIVQQLEDSLGVKLIDRSKRPFVLTEEGKVYYEGCRRLVQSFFALEEKVRTLRQQVEGRVNVASIYSVGLSYGNELVREFTERYPKATVHWEYHHPQQVYELVTEGQADIGLVSCVQQTRALKAVPWLDEPIILVCSPTHVLAKRTSLNLAELDGLEVIGFDQDLSIRRSIDRELAVRQVHLQVAMAFDNIDTIKRAIEVNAGVSLLPEPTVRRELVLGSLLSVPVTGLDLVRPLAIICRRGNELGPTARRFMQLIQEDREGLPELAEGSRAEADLEEAGTEDAGPAEETASEAARTPNTTTSTRGQ